MRLFGLGWLLGCGIWGRLVGPWMRFREVLLCDAAQLQYEEFTSRVWKIVSKERRSRI